MTPALMARGWPGGTHNAGAVDRPTSQKQTVLNMITSIFINCQWLQKHNEAQLNKKRPTDVRFHLLVQYTYATSAATAKCF